MHYSIDHDDYAATFYPFPLREHPGAISFGDTIEQFRG